MRCCPDMKIFAKRGAQKLHRMNSGAFRREAAAALVWAYIIIIIRIFFGCRWLGSAETQTLAVLFNDDLRQHFRESSTDGRSRR
jgi:hypothetical protein